MSRGKNEYVTPALEYHLHHVFAAFHNQIHFYIETIKNILENNYSLLLSNN